MSCGVLPEMLHVFLVYFGAFSSLFKGMGCLNTMHINVSVLKQRKSLGLKTESGAPSTVSTVALNIE